jgi:hypothetical protein
MEPILVQKVLYSFMVYLCLASIVAIALKGKRAQGFVAPKYLSLCAALAVCCAIAIPLAYRILPTETEILSWECETVLNHFEALQNKQSTQDFAHSAIKVNQGLLSTSAKSVLFGIPTYSLFQLWGWSTFSLRFVAFLLGLGALGVSFIVIRDLFNTSTALLFVTLLATNPVMLYYMGYGVSQTATLFGFLLGLCASIKAIFSAKRVQLAWAMAAGALLFLATFNYAPGRIFVAVTLGFLLLYCLPIWRAKSAPARSRLFALTIIVVAGALFWAQREINSLSVLTAVRGEQVFIMAEHTDQLALYLGQKSSEERQRLGYISLWTMLRFCVAVASHRLHEFFVLFSPMKSFPSYWMRGSQHGESFPPYPSALIIPMAIGFFTLLRQLFTLRSLLLLSLFIGGLVPLLFTSRVDNHRAFLLLIPITAWSAHGLSAIREQLRGRWLAETHCALLFTGITICLIANTWQYLGAPDQVDPNTSLMLSELDNQLESQASVVSAGLNCQTQAAIDLRAAENARTAPDRAPVLWGRDIADKIVDGKFTSDSKELQEIAASALHNPLITVSSLPVTSWTTWLRDSNLQVTENELGNFRVVVAKTRD